MFSKYIQNGRGYTLLTTFTVIILLTVIGLSLLSATMNGTKKNNTRETISQSLNLSEKGLDYITKDINTSLADFTKTGVSRDDFIDELEKYNPNNPKYKCIFDNGKLVGGLEVKTNKEADDSIACIKAVYPADDGNDLKRKLEIVSAGTVDGKHQQLTTMVEIGADKVPEQLKYALTSKGNIHLNGAVQITGDLRFGGSLTTYNRAHIISSSTHYWVESLKPSIKSTSKRSNPRIVVGDKSKFFSVIKKTDQDNSLLSNIQNLKSGILETKTKDNIDSLFDLSVFEKKPTVVTTDSEIQSVNIASKKSAYYYTSSSATNLKSIYNSFRISPGTYNGKQYLQQEYEVSKSCGRSKICYETKYSYLDPSSTFVLSNGHYEFNKLATNASLKITSDSDKTTKVKINDTLYIEGDLTIEGNVELEGSIFVNGRVIINKTNLKTNSLVYVNNYYDPNNNAVDIQYSTISSLPYLNSEGEQKNGTLVVFSKGNIKLANNSLNSEHDQPSEIYGYLYSDKALEIYGVGSNIKIHGGIYGARITLHAIRGTAKDKNFTGANKYGSDYYMKSDLQDNYKTYNADQLINDPRCNYPNENNKKKCYEYHSRLQVHYNEDVVSTYVDLNRQEELIYNVALPRIIDKKY